MLAVVGLKFQVKRLAFPANPEANVGEVPPVLL
jgi:hypothetical protein